VPDLSHDTSEDGFHEIQLSGKQLVFLFMTATIVSVFIFLCGVLVGRGARDVRLGEITAASAATLDTPQPMAQSGPPAVEPPAPADAPDELSYHERLQGTGTPNEDLKKSPKPDPPAPAPPPQAAPAVTPRAATVSDVPTSGRSGTHVVQVFVSRDKAIASALVKKLIGNGYPAFLLPPDSPTVPQIYKVQVGRFNERDAEEAARKLEREGDFKPWVISSR
jgi:cell division septation protein DedD